MYTKNKNMAIISSYPLATPDVDDYVVGTKLQTQGQNINPTKNFTIREVVETGIAGIPKATDNADALVQGLVAGQLYQTNGTGAAPLNVPGIVMIVV
tara:strand:- start:213 stop:503 length:291 start_codon:yes stop_codon:yes gene_type:complete